MENGNGKTIDDSQNGRPGGATAETTSTTNSDELGHWLHR